MFRVSATDTEHAFSSLAEHSRGEGWGRTLAHRSRPAHGRPATRGRCCECLGRVFHAREGQSPELIRRGVRRSKQRDEQVVAHGVCKTGRPQDRRRRARQDVSDKFEIGAMFSRRTGRAWEGSRKRRDDAGARRANRAASALPLAACGKALGREHPAVGGYVHAYIRSVGSSDIEPHGCCGACAFGPAAGQSEVRGWFSSDRAFDDKASSESRRYGN